MVTYRDAIRERGVRGAGKPVSGPRASVKYAVEAIGTFFLVFTVGAAVEDSTALAPLSIGAIVMVMVYAGGHVSGGHYNPAVTLAVLVRRRIGLCDAMGYWFVQFGAGLLAALAVQDIIHPSRIAMNSPRALSGHTLLAAFMVELIFTFALCYVVLNVATSRHQQDNSYYGLAIGFTVAAGAIAVGPVSGAAFNPSVTFGGALMGIFAWPTLWIYPVAQVVGGLAAGATFLALNPDDR